MNLILLGAPGAGKGTQGALLAETFGLSRISTGDLLREAVRRGTDLGLRAKSYMDAGELVPDDVILGLLREVLRDDEGSAGAIFDGFPRTLPQARALDVLLEELDSQLDAIFVVDVPEDALIKRLSGRRSCPSCGAVYNVFFEPPRREGICDACGSPLVERADDSADTVRNRLAVYHRQTEPLIEYYQNGETPVVHVDGDRPVDEVQRDMVAALKR